MATPKTGRPRGRPKGTKSPKTRAMEAARLQMQEQLIADAKRTLNELSVIGTVNIQDYFDASGNLIPIHQLDRRLGSAIASLEVIKKNMAAGDGVTDTVAKMKLWDKLKALEMLAKHFGLLVEKLEHSGGIEIRWQDGNPS